MSAKAQGVDVQKVIDALVQDQKDEVAAAVKAGTMTQAQADQQLANVTTHVTDRGQRDRLRPRRPGRWRARPRRPGGTVHRGRQRHPERQPVGRDRHQRLSSAPAGAPRDAADRPRPQAPESGPAKPFLRSAEHVREAVGRAPAVTTGAATRLGAEAAGWRPLGAALRRGYSSAARG